MEHGAYNMHQLTLPARAGVRKSEPNDRAGADDRLLRIERVAVRQEGQRRVALVAHAAAKRTQHSTALPTSRMANHDR